MDGSAFRGLGTVVAFGVVAIHFTWLLGIPAAVASAYWLIAPRLDWPGTWRQAFAYTALAWCALNTLWFAYWWAYDFIQDRLRARRHAEFMRLRAMFYRNDEVCLDSLETLRKRAAGRA